MEALLQIGDMEEIVLSHKRKLKGLRGGDRKRTYQVRSVASVLTSHASGQQDRRVRLLIASNSQSLCVSRSAEIVVLEVMSTST